PGVAALPTNEYPTRPDPDRERTEPPPGRRWAARVAMRRFVLSTWGSTPRGGGDHGENHGCVDPLDGRSQPRTRGVCPVPGGREVWRRWRDGRPGPHHRGGAHGPHRYRGDGVL